jgi:hypothetical protein
MTRKAGREIGELTGTSARASGVNDVGVVAEVHVSNRAFMKPNQSYSSRDSRSARLSSARWT